MPTHDIIIVGLRCAGAPLAMRLARHGMKVLALDRATFPSDTISTHFLWPRTTARLARWGLLDRLLATGCPPIETVTFDTGPQSITGRPDPVDGTDTMVCPRRRVLDSLLVSAAREAGADIRQATTVTSLLWHHDRVVGVETAGPDGSRTTEHATMVIGADGLWSRVATAAGAAIDLTHPSRSCGHYAYWSGVPVHGVEFYRRANRVILAFPTHDGQTCLYVGWPHAQSAAYRADLAANYRDTLALAPDLAARVSAGRQSEPFRGSNRLPNQYRQAWGKGWALAGDAAYHRDPITGMGIGDAFLGADLLADAIIAGATETTLAAYQDTLHAETRGLMDYTVLSAGLDDPAPLAAFYAGVAADPAATRQLMNVLAGTLPFRAFFNRATIARLSASQGSGPPMPPAQA